MSYRIAPPGGHLPARPAAIVATAVLMLLGAACASDTVLAPRSDARAPQVSLAVAASGGVQACVPDSKLVGRVALTTDDVPGTWWYITREGFDAAGITDYLAFIEYAFGQDFATLDEAIAHLVSVVVPLDTNGNGYVCAYETRGERANYGLPEVSRYIFHVRDDEPAGT